MDRSKRDDRPTARAEAQASDGCKVLKFTPRAPRLAFADYGSGWYHQTAIDAADLGPGAKR